MPNLTCGFSLLLLFTGAALFKVCRDNEEYEACQNGMGLAGEVLLIVGGCFIACETCRICVTCDCEENKTPTTRP